MTRGRRANPATGCEEFLNLRDWVGGIAATRADHHRASGLSGRVPGRRASRVNRFRTDGDRYQGERKGIAVARIAAFESCVPWISMTSMIASVSANLSGSSMLLTNKADRRR
jgi:hypothetical protein